MGAAPVVAAAAGAASVVALARARHRPRPSRPLAGSAPARSIDRRRVRTAVAAIGALAGLVLVGPVPGALLVLAGLTARSLARRSARRRHDARVEAALPELVELLALASSAGHPVVTCLRVVADRAPEPTRPALRAMHARVAHGASLAASVERAGPALGPLGPALAEALVASLVTGAPLTPALGRLAAAARDRRRRQAEEAARRLPVTLAFPLVCCTLPAFALLALVPVLVAALGSLHP